MHGYRKTDMIYTNAILAFVNDRSECIYRCKNYKYFGTIVSAYISSTLSIHVDVYFRRRSTKHGCNSWTVATCRLAKSADNVSLSGAVNGGARLAIDF